MKKYKAIFFDWDGTAVLSRRAPVTEAVTAMAPLLDAGVKLAIISGTTYDRVAGGQLHTYFTEKQLENLIFTCKMQRFSPNDRFCETLWLPILLYTNQSGVCKYGGIFR